MWKQYPRKHTRTHPGTNAFELLYVENMLDGLCSWSVWYKSNSSWITEWSPLAKKPKSSIHHTLIWLKNHEQVCTYFLIPNSCILYIPPPRSFPSLPKVGRYYLPPPSVLYYYPSRSTHIPVIRVRAYTCKFAKYAKYASNSCIITSEPTRAVSYIETNKRKGTERKCAQADGISPKVFGD